MIDHALIMALSKKHKIAVIVVISIVSLYLFYSTLSIPNLPKTFTEHNSNRLQFQLEVEQNSDIRQYGFNFQPNLRPSLPVDSTVRQQLSYQFVYEPKKPFPKNIWQTWKVGIDDVDFPKDYKVFAQSWILTNPEYKHYVLPDESCHELINQLYQGVPDVVIAYNSMPKSILKADFFRYLILFARGGVYSDIDTKGLRPISSWISLNETYNDKPNNAGIVVGIEADPDRPDWADWYARRIQFCQWTIQLKKGHPLLRDLIANITDITLTRKTKGQLTKVLGKDEGGDIMNWTGPGIWTDSVFKYLNNIMQPQENFKSKKYDEIIDWKLFTGATQPIVVDDVMVLPITSFSPDVGQMGAQSSLDPMAYAKHMFLGSWKPAEERM